MADEAHTEERNRVSDHAQFYEASRPSAPLTPDAFIADRQRFWVQFTRFLVICAGSTVVLLVLLALFLV